MATQDDEDVFEVSILLLKVLPNEAELIKDNCLWKNYNPTSVSSGGPD